MEGLFSAVAVPPSYARQGIGKALVKAAEKYTLAFCKKGKGAMLAILKMGVISARNDLFKWYSAQGFVMGPEMPHTEELNLICLPDTDIRLIEKSVQFADSPSPYAFARSQDAPARSH